MSLWTPQSLQNFLKSVSTLHSCSEVPGQRVTHNPAEWLRQNPDREIIHGLSFEDERRLADDLAFVVRFDEGVKYVSSVAVEQSAEPPHLTIRVAANEGVDDKVMQTLQTVGTFLAMCAQNRKILCWATPSFAYVP